jgi:hypothetical protein
MLRRLFILLALLCVTLADAAQRPILTIDRPGNRSALFTDAGRIDLSGDAAGNTGTAASDGVGDGLSDGTSADTSMGTRVGISATGIRAVWVERAGTAPVRARLRPAPPGATGHVAWFAPGIALRPGRNIVRIRAIDQAQHASTRYLTVWRDAPAPRADGAGTDGLGVVYSGALWPKVGGVAQVPYTVTQGNANVGPAIALFNTTFAGVIQWVPRTSEADFVDFDLDPNNFSGTGESQWVGRHGGQQEVGGSIDIDLGTVLHEMGHVAGLFHEHSRADRDAYIAVQSANIIKTLALGNFDAVTEGAQATGLYDYASVMHYQPYTFTKNGLPTISSIPAGIPISALGTYSAGDIDTVKRLYQQAPAQVTVTTNPPGLQVLVDGAAVTTPHNFNFALNSVHTLGVPAGAQSLSGTGYTYGRWNDNTLASHSITIAPGNGATGSPANRPAVTVYQANFIELVPFTPTVYPAGAGTLTATPAAQSYPPLAGVYYPQGQPVALVAKPAKGYSFYSLYTADGPDGLASKTTYYPDSVGNVLFTPQPTVTIGSNPTDRWVWVDGGFWFAPVIFSPYYDSGWAAGSPHTVDVSVSPQYPYSYSIRYPWTAWTDGGPQSHSITVPAGKATYTAQFGQEFYAAYWADQPCAGSVSASPASADGFYAAGGTVSFRQTPVAGWTFTGWLQDATGKTNPKQLPMTDERLLIANYNTTSAALSLTSLAPASALAGQSGFTLTIKGSGFSPTTSAVYIGGTYRAPTSVSATQIKVPITAADVATAGAVQVYVENFPAGNWPCSAYTALSLVIRSAKAQPLAAPTPTALTFAAQPVGTQSAAQTVTLTNGGTATLAYDDRAVTGANPADFATSTTCGSGLGAAAQCTVSVTFTPTAAGARSARLMLIDSALNSPQTLPLSGTGSP